MRNTLKEAILHRRTYYSITNSTPVDDVEIENIVRFAVLNVPSAFNSQSTRVVLLLGEEHRKLWSIAMNALRAVVPAANFGNTEARINSFAAGYGTVLYFEEQTVVESLRKAYPAYAANFPVWSEQTSAMHQFAIWTMLEDAGFGASLQHYSELIAADVTREWGLSSSWKLIAQMPFGTPTAEPAAKVFEPIDDRVLIFR